MAGSRLGNLFGNVLDIVEISAQIPIPPSQMPSPHNPQPDSMDLVISPPAQSTLQTTPWLQSQSPCCQLIQLPYQLSQAVVGGHLCIYTPYPWSMGDIMTSISPPKPNIQEQKNKVSHNQKQKQKNHLPLKANPMIRRPLPSLS